MTGIVLITGATSDFGRAFAHKFANNGTKLLLLHGRNLNKLKALQDELSCPSEIIVCDLYDNDAIEAHFSEMAQQHEIDLLINNAGGAIGAGPAHEAEIMDWQNMVQANVTSLIQITQAILPGMVQRKKGHIINIGSIAGNWPYPGGHVYCASKSFVKQFSLALRSDLLGKNVRVSNIEPGAVETEFSLRRFKGDKDKADAVYANTRALQAEDIANTVYFVAAAPEHVNITSLEIMSTDQALAGLTIHRYTE